MERPIPSSYRKGKVSVGNEPIDSKSARRRMLRARSSQHEDAFKSIRCKVYPSAYALMPTMTAGIKCTNCGKVNGDDATKCKFCGHALHASEAETQECPHCHAKTTPVGHDTCISCGWNISSRQVVRDKDEKTIEPAECESSAEAPLHTVRSFNVYLAAIFMLVAGALGIFHAMAAALPDTSSQILSAYESVIPQGELLDDILKENVVLSALMFLFGVLSIALSMSAMRRSNYAASVAGSVFGILSIGFLFGSFFGLMALILLVTSRREFLLECA